jgi:hypothetical protein
MLGETSQILIHVKTLNLVCKIASSSNSPLQPWPEPAVDPLEVVTRKVAADVLDGGDQGLLLIVGGLINLSRRKATKNKLMDYR